VGAKERTCTLCKRILELSEIKKEVTLPDLFGYSKPKTTFSFDDYYLLFSEIFSHRISMIITYYSLIESYKRRKSLSQKEEKK